MIGAAVELCKRFEGFSSKPYRCPADVPTIGYGSTYYADGRKVTLQDPPITQAQAERLLLLELRRTYLPGVRRICPTLYVRALLEADARRLCAIVDFAYNLGVGALQTSTLARALRAEDWEWASRELMRWVRGGGRVLPGLVRRRAAESALMT